MINSEKFQRILFSLILGGSLGNLYDRIYYSAVPDYIDLDSHFNLDPDPTSGATYIDGIVTPVNKPGHGAYFNNA